MLITELITEELFLNIAIMLNEHNVHICLDLIIQLVPRVLTVVWNKNLIFKIISLYRGMGKKRDKSDSFV